MDPVHSWKALLSVLGAQEARSTGHERSGTVTPFSAAHARTNGAAATPYYTPAPISPAPGPAATPIDAWYSIISSLKGEAAGGSGSPSGLGRRLQNSPGGGSDAGSPGSIRQQLFQTAAKTSKQGGRSSRLQLQSTASHAVAASSTDMLSATVKPAGGRAGVEPAIQSGSPQQMQGSAAKTQQLAARLGDLRASAERIKAHDMSSVDPGNAGRSISNSKVTAQRLHAAGVVGSGTRSKQATTPLSRRLFASPSRQTVAVEAAPRFSFTALAGNGVCSPIAGLTNAGGANVTQPPQKPQQQQQQLAAVVSQMEELLVAVKQQQAAAMKQQHLQQQQQQQPEGPDCNPVDGLHQLVQQMAAAVKQDHHWQQQQQPGPATVPGSLLAPATVESTPAPPQPASSQAAGLRKQQQPMMQEHIPQEQQQLLQQQCECASLQAAAASSEFVQSTRSAAAADGLTSAPDTTGRNSPSNKRAGLLLGLPSSEAPKLVLHKRCNTWSGGQATKQQPETEACQSPRVHRFTPSAPQLDVDVQEDSTDAGCLKPQVSPNSSSPSHSTSNRVAFEQTVPGSSPTSPSSRSPRQPGGPASTAAGSPDAAVGPGGSYTARFQQQSSIQQTAPAAGKAPKSPRLLRSRTAVGAAGGSAAINGDGAQRLRRQWTVPGKLPAGRRAANDTRADGEATQQQQRRPASSPPDSKGLPASKEGDNATDGGLAAAAMTADLALTVPSDEESSAAAACTPSVVRSRSSNMEHLNAKFQALNREWSSMTGAHSSKKRSSRYSPTQTAGTPVVCQAAAAAPAGIVGVGSDTDTAVVAASFASGPVVVSTPVAMHNNTPSATRESSAFATLVRVVSSTNSQHANKVKSASFTAADGVGDTAVATLLQRPHSSGSIGSSRDEQEQHRQEQQEQHALEGYSTSVGGLADVRPRAPVADGNPLQVLCSPSTPAAALPRVHTPGKSAAEAAAQTATPMLANSAAAVLNLSEAWREETGDTQAKWKQLLEEWSADDLPLNTSSNSSTDLLPSSHSAALVSSTGGGDQIISAAEGDKQRPGSAASEFADVNDTGVAAGQAMEPPDQQQQQYVQDAQQQPQREVTESSPARTHLQPATTPLLFSPGSAVESEASEISLAALTIKAAGQQQQQAIACSPDPTAAAPTARQLFVDGSTPGRHEVVGNSQPTDEPCAAQQTGVQQTLQPQQQLQGLETEDISEKLLANLRDVHDQLAAERQQKHHQPHHQHHSLQASTAGTGLQQQHQLQQASTDQAAGRQPGHHDSQALQLPAVLGGPLNDSQQVSPAPSADVNSTADHTMTGSAITAQGTAATAVPSAAGQVFVAVNTEDSFNQLLVSLRDVHDRLAAERRQQQQQQQHRRRQQQHSQVTEESFEGLLMSLRDVHDQLAALRRPQQHTTAAAAAAAMVAAGRAAHLLLPPPTAQVDDVVAVTAEEGSLPASAASSSSTSTAAYRQATPAALQLSGVPPLAQTAADSHAAAALAAVAAGTDLNAAKPFVMKQPAAGSRDVSSQLGPAAAVSNITSSSATPSLAQHTTADERFSVLRQRLQESRAALQAIGVPAAADGTPPSAATPAADRDVSPLALPVSGWLKATQLHHYLARSRLQQGMPVAAAAVRNGIDRQLGTTHVLSLNHKWRIETSARPQSDFAPVAAYVAPQPAAAPWQQQQHLGSEIASLGLSPLSPLYAASHTTAAGSRSTRTPVASHAAARTTPGMDVVHTPGTDATPAAVGTVPQPTDLLFPMSPLLSSSTGVYGSSAGTAAAARAVGASTTLALAAGRGLQNLSSSAAAGSQQGSRLTTPYSQSAESAYSAGNSPPSVNMLQQWVRHGSPTKRIKQHLRSRARQEQQQQQQRNQHQQQQQQLDVQLGVAQAALQGLDRSRAALHAAAQEHAVSGVALHRRQFHEGSDTSAIVADQTVGFMQPWSGNPVGKSPAALLTATATVAEDAAAALAAAAAASGSARSISPTSRLKGLRVQQAVAVSNQQQGLVEAQQLRYQQQPSAAPSAAVAATAVSSRYNMLQSGSTIGGTGTWLQAAALNRQQQNKSATASRLETAAAGLASVRRQLAATGVSKGDDGRVTGLQPSFPPVNGPQGVSK